MKKNLNKKLQLKKNVVARLDNRAMGQVAGGIGELPTMNFCFSGIVNCIPTNRGCVETLADC